MVLGLSDLSDLPYFRPSFVTCRSPIPSCSDPHTLLLRHHVQLDDPTTSQ